MLSWMAATRCPPTAPAIWSNCSRRCANTTPAKIATVNGRYYAMDRDRRWERIAKAYNAMVLGDAEGGKFADPVQGMKDSYNRGVTDEFVVPFVCTDKNGQALAHAFATKTPASASTSAPTGSARSRARWRATAD